MTPLEHEPAAALAGQGDGVMSPPITRRITFLNLYFYPDESATSYLITDLALYLASQGCDVSVVTGRKLFRHSHETLASEEFVAGVKVKRIWTAGFGRSHLIGLAIDYLTFYASALVMLMRTIRRDDILITNTDPPLISVVASGVAKIKKAKAINWIFDIHPEAGRALRLKSFSWPIFHSLRYLRNWSVKNAAANVAIGKRMARFINDECRPATPTHIIHNWSDSTAFQSVSTEENALRQQLRVGEKFIVCYTGNMGRGHEFETLLAAAELLRSKLDVEFVFVGGGNQRAYLEREAQRRKLTNFHFLPHQTRANNFLSHSLGDVYIVSLQPEMEGYSVPSKFYAVACAGKPTLFIGDPAGEIAEIVAGEEIGFAVKKNDASDLAEKISLLAVDAEFRNAMGRRARELFCNRFDRPIALANWYRFLSGI